MKKFKIFRTKKELKKEGGTNSIVYYYSIQIEKT